MGEYDRGYGLQGLCSKLNVAVVVGQRSIRKTGFSMARTLGGQLYMEEDREYRDGIPRIDSKGKPCINSAADPYGKRKPFFSECAKNDYYTNRYKLHCLKRCKKQKNKPKKHARVKTPCFDNKTGCNKLKPLL